MTDKDKDIVARAIPVGHVYTGIAQGGPFNHQPISHHSPKVTVGHTIAGRPTGQTSTYTHAVLTFHDSRVPNMVAGDGLEYKDGVVVQIECWLHPSITNNPKLGAKFDQDCREGFALVCWMAGLSKLTVD